MIHQRFKVGDVVWCNTVYWPGGRAYGIVTEMNEDGSGRVAFVVAPREYHEAFRDKDCVFYSFSAFYLAEPEVLNGEE